MTARAFYNEIDPYCCAWLSNLMDVGEITSGKIDDRPIQELTPDDVRGYERAHFFAGIGGWDIALDLAGWGDRPVWSGSCPCQPFSAAGAGKAANDERHLWPAWASLIAECRPRTVFGEQVEAAIGWGWLDLVFTDLEAEGYAVGSAVLPACSVSAPHIRNRLWFVADADRSRPGAGRGDAGEVRGLQEAQRQPELGSALSGGGGAARGVDDAAGARRDGTLCQPEGNTRDKARLRLSGAGREARGVADAECSERGSRGPERRGAASGRPTGELAGCGDAGELADAVRPGRAEGRAGTGHGPTAGSGIAGRLGDANSERSQGRPGNGSGSVSEGWETPERPLGLSGGVLGGFWSDAEWLPCSDGKARPAKSGTFVLAHGVQRRPSKLRAYGNAIVPPLAAEFVAAFMEARP